MFPAWWTKHFGSVSPLGYRLRAAFPDRWFRIHSLPGSKRYPQTPEELEVLLRRHAAVAAKIVRPGQPCTMMTATYGSGAVGDRGPLPGFGDRTFECIASLLDPEDYEQTHESSRKSYWAASTRWDPAAERSVLVAIAEDELRALWLDRRSGEVYAPYDGGADLIVSSRGRRNRLRKECSDWLSARRDGL